MKVVIVGGVAGGATFATRIRRLDEKAQILIFEKSKYVSYANCGLPYYIGDIIKDEEDLTVQTPEGLKQRFNIDVKVRHEVIKIDVNNKRVLVKNLANGQEFFESYDKLLLSTGAKPIKPNINGVSLKNVFSLRTVEDTFSIKNYINENDVKNIAVVGGGYIGVEITENLVGIGKNVTVIQHSNHLMNTLDFDMACYVHNTMRVNGVNLMLNTSVIEIQQKDNQTIVKTSANDVVVDMVILAVGIVPDTSFVDNLKIEKGIKGSIIVNDKMETSIKDIYAVGDCIQVKNYITNNDALISLAGPANKQGRIVADNICGGNSHYNGTQGSSIFKLFNKTVATTGINETMAKKLGYDCQSVVLSPMDKAGYYPNGHIMTIKLTFENKTEKILGAQIFGFSGVDKRIDVIATAIRGNIKASKLAELELSYAPPYSSAKDPVNMAGFIIENVVNGLVKQYDYNKLLELPTDGSVTLLDTRTEGEYLRGNVKGFINVPLDCLRDRINEIKKDKKVYVMCQSGLRSYLACRILIQNGFDAYNFVGGFGHYKVIALNEQMTNQSFPCGKEKK